MKILLIWSRIVYEKVFWPPLGLMYLASVLKKEGFQVEIFDFIKRYNPALVAKEIKNRRPDIIGVGFETENRYVGFETIKIAKSVLPKSLVIAGGIHVSLTAEDTLNNIHELDAIVRGEGEETLLEFCKAVEGNDNLSKIDGLSFRWHKDIVHNSARIPIQNLDNIPFPDYKFLVLKQYSLFNEGGFLTITTRGCSFNCTFCCSPVFWGRRVRFRSIPNILAEIEYLVSRYRIKKIIFIDDTFTLDKQRVTQLCQALIEERRKNNWNFFWQCNIRCDKVVTKDLLALMREAGCLKLGAGVESGSPQVLSQIKKNIDLEHVRNIVTWCKELGLEIFCVFMMNFPTESESDFKETLRFMDELNKFSHVRVSPPSWLKIYPGTEIEKLAYRQGILPPDFSWSKPHNIPGLHGVPYFVKKNMFKDVEKFSEEVDRLTLKLRFRYKGFKIWDFWNTLKRIKIRSIGDIRRYLRKFIILVTDFLLPKIKNKLNWLLKKPL